MPWELKNKKNSERKKNKRLPTYHDNNQLTIVCDKKHTCRRHLQKYQKAFNDKFFRITFFLFKYFFRI